MNKTATDSSTTKTNPTTTGEWTAEDFPHKINGQDIDEEIRQEWCDKINSTGRNIVNERDQLAIAVDEWKQKYQDANAALAAEREMTQKLIDQNTSYREALEAERRSAEDHARGEKAYCEAFDRVSKQLAAERELRERAESNMRVFVDKEHTPLVEQLREQLDAEREKRELAEIDTGKQIDDLQQQLATERSNAEQFANDAGVALLTVAELQKQLATERGKVQTLRDALTKIRDAALKTDWNLAQRIDDALAKVK